MESTILQALEDLQYTGSLKDANILKQAVDDGPKSVDYTKLVNFVTSELRSLCSIDEEVNVIAAPEDSVAFVMEISSFLKELGCPHQCLIQGHVSDRLCTREDRLLLLDYLLTELMSARILQESKPNAKIELKLKETDQALHLKKMMMTLRFPKPPTNISAQMLFQKMNAAVQSIVDKAGPDLLGAPICNFTISDQHWKTLGKVQKDLHEEYTIRREMLLKRLDCTIQSFQWSDKMKGKDELINKTYTDKRKQLRVDPDVNIADLISARQDLAIIEKTSNASVRKNTQTAVNKVIIGQVPDRGGRTSEQAPPPPEMPSWQQRQSGPPGGFGGRGGRGGGQRGGRGDFNNQGGGGGYSRGGSNQNSYRGGGNTNNYQGGGNANSYQGGGNPNNYQGGGNPNNYQGGGANRNDNFSKGAISYSSNSIYGSSKPVSYGGTVSYGTSFDAAGSYSTSFGGNSSSGGGNNYKSDSFDSAGSYHTEPKRPKTYDSFQNNKSTYADQYVQESQNNQQYNPRGGRGGGGRGKSNYNRGGGGGRQNFN